MGKWKPRKGHNWVKLESYLLNSAAWMHMTPNARAIYVALRQRYNGQNNGEISMSSREAGRALNASDSTGARALLELGAHGFVRIGTPSSFNRKLKLATCYVLTEERDDRPGEQSSPTKDFMKWKRPAEVRKTNHSFTGANNSFTGDTERQNTATIYPFQSRT